MGMKYPLSPISNPPSARRLTNPARQMSYVYDDDEHPRNSVLDGDGQRRGSNQAVDGLYHHAPEMRPATAPHSVLAMPPTHDEGEPMELMAGGTQRLQHSFNDGNAAVDRPTTASCDNQNTRHHHPVLGGRPTANTRYQNTRDDSDRSFGSATGAIKPFKSPLKPNPIAKAAFETCPEEREGWVGTPLAMSTRPDDVGIAREETEQDALSEQQQMANPRQTDHIPPVTDVPSSQPRSGERPETAGRDIIIPTQAASPSKPSPLNPETTSTSASASTAAAAASPLETVDPSLQSYLAVPTEERTALLESWICRQLDNDGFVALCSDMEGIWRRIGYGC